MKNKVLRDPRQKRFFTSRGMRDLFTLGDDRARGTETSSIFGSLDTEIVHRGQHEDQEDRRRSTHTKSTPNTDDGTEKSQESYQITRHRSDSQKGRVASERNGAECSDGEDALAENGLCAGELHHTALRSVDGAAADGGGVENDGDAKILLELVKGRDLRTAMDHSKIETANDTEVLAVDLEASRVAQEAAERLRESRRACQSSSIAVPTWTGRSGAAGAPQERPRRRFGQVVNPLLDVGSSGTCVVFVGSSSSSSRLLQRNITSP